MSGKAAKPAAADGCLQQSWVGIKGSAKYSALAGFRKARASVPCGRFSPATVRETYPGRHPGRRPTVYPRRLVVTEADKTGTAPEFAGPHQHGKGSCDVMHHPISVWWMQRRAVSQPDPVPCRWRTMWQTRLHFDKPQPVPRPSINICH